MIKYDDTRLRKLFAGLTPSQRKNTFKMAFRKQAKVIKKIAQENVLSSGLNHSGQLSRGVRTVIFRREAGFRIAVSPKKKKKIGFHTNRYGKEKPVLMWAEKGTKKRKTKGGWFKPGSRRGAMPAYGFLEKTKNRVIGTVSDELHIKIVDCVKKMAKKYGCT